HLQVFGCLRVRDPAIPDQPHRLKLELPRKPSSLHDSPPVPSKHLTRCLRNRVQARWAIQPPRRIHLLREVLWAYLCEVLFPVVASLHVNCFLDFLGLLLDPSCAELGHSRISLSAYFALLVLARDPRCRPWDCRINSTTSARPQPLRQSQGSP